jgi:hypothetical protein
MTHHDLLIDAIIDEIYYLWTEVSNWDNKESQEIAKETAQRILEHVEEFQQKKASITTKMMWRASD